ncbi:MAG TPA: DNA polymerase III subunit alpha [Candidatus Binatia bacterium]|nr:DNA polymerase III subunit alpha [Candidatus Binatia bacterium]
MPSEMETPSFVHLHLHTDYSLLDGACRIPDLVSEAARRGMPAVAVTDHGNLFAAAKFYQEATTRGVKPILGCEMYVARGSHKDKTTDPDAGGSGRANHLVLLAETQQGYRNLMKLVSTGFLDGFYYKPRVDHDLLAKHSEGLIALSACLRGEVSEALAEDKETEAREAAGRLRDIFGKGNFFLEVQDQGLEIEKKVNRGMVRLSRESGIPLVATNDAHYLSREDSRAQEVLLCIQTGKTMSDPHRMRFATDQFYFKTAEEMAQVFRELPDALSRTAEIAARCKVRIEPVNNPFPEFQVPAGYTPESFFERVVKEGFAGRAPRIERLASAGRLRHSLAEYEQRLAYELEVIKKMRFAGYFLIVWDFIRYARAQGVPVGPGRGSAAGSLVSYSLGITDVDPLQYDLLFERFLNPERVSLPDIDIDFCMRRRGEVIDYVTQTYGRENVAQIITFGTLAAKAAIKDSGRALDLPFGDVDRLAKQIPQELNIKLEKAWAESAQLRAAVEKDERFVELMDVARRLEGFARHASTHAAGVVISPQPLVELVPLYKSNREEITTQYDMNALEKLGLLKMDFLGLTTLTIVDDAVKLIAQHRGAALDLAELPLDDPATYQLFCRAETSGIFQFESHGMRDILRRYQPSRLEDLTALNALYRPGPIQGGMIDDFIARKHGRKKVTYDLPELQDILQETFGVILYQEQVIQIANRLAGYSLGEADLLRRAMGKKKKEEMAAQREKFLTGCRARKIPEKKAERIFDLMEEFAGYGFNKSHACAYALLAYQIAWLKAHYPVEFFCALLTSETGNSDKMVKYIGEARAAGITVLPPDVNSSDMDFTPAGEAIRFGLRAIRNVGENAVRGILEARQATTGFRSLAQFCEAVDLRLLNRRMVESLIRAGAMDSLGARRAQLMAMIDRAMEEAQRMGRARSVGQHGLFGGGTSQAAEPPADLLPDVEEWPEHERLAREYEMLGFYVSGHPLERFRARLEELSVCPLGTLEERAQAGDGADVTVAGIVAALRPMRSKKGARWAILTLQDMTGAAEVLAFPESFARYERLLRTGATLVVKGRISVEDVGTRVILTDARSLEGETGAAGSALLRLHVDTETIDEESLNLLKQLFASRPGTCRVCFVVATADGTVGTQHTAYRVRADEDLLARVRHLLGEAAVELSGAGNIPSGEPAEASGASLAAQAPSYPRGSRVA